MAGLSTAELAAGLVIAVPLFLALFELAMIFIIAQATDAVTNEAARVAAAGDPQKAVVRVQNVINRANQEQRIMSSLMKLQACTFTPADLLTEEAKMIPFGGTLNGDVTIQIQCQVKPWLFSLFTNNQPIVFKSQKTFPFSYLVPNTAGGLPPAP
jgi:hypothetical protein